jgi:hypothetical protein
MLGRFLVGSALLWVGGTLVLSAAITVVGLPIGLIVVGAGLQLMLAPSSPGPSTRPRAPGGSGSTGRGT